MTTYRALFVTETQEGTFEKQVIERSLADLPDHDVLIRVKASSLNYKDALSASGNKGVTRQFPHQPGIDAAGVVERSSDTRFQPGDEVIVTGYDLGMNTAGGLGEYIAVPGDWIVRKPEGLSLEEAMMYGTAGFTAALSVDALRKVVSPEDGKVLVTGASGGVGSTAVALLAKQGYTVVAATGKPEKADHLKHLGASEIVDRKDIDDHSGRPMLKGLYAGVIDTAGGNTLATALKVTAYGGAVTTCGNVAVDHFESSVYPFILRGITLFGIDSVQRDHATRERVWGHLATDWRPDHLTENVNHLSLDEALPALEALLSGKHSGRSVVHMDR